MTMSVSVLFDICTDINGRCLTPNRRNPKASANISDIECLKNQKSQCQFFKKPKKQKKKTKKSPYQSTDLTHGGLFF
jgi:hypothetical protein